MISNPEPAVLRWVPHEIQEAFIKLPFEVFEALYGGAAGGGKSESLVLLPLIYDFHQHRKFKGIILRRTMPELEKEIIIRSHQWYAGARYNETKKRWTWPSGAIMQFGHAEKEQAIRIYDGIEYNYIGWDEVTSFTPFQYEYLFSRARSSTADLPSIIRAATNPGGIGHNYFRARFVEPNRLGFRIIKDKKTGLLRIYIPCKAQDNKYLMANDPTYLQKLAMISNEAERKAKLDGDWWTFEGQVFKEFRIEPFNDEPATACHVIKPFPIPTWWPRVIAIDWGWAANTSIGWGAISPDGRVFVYRTYNEKTKYIKEWAREACKLSAGEPIKDVVICHSAGQQRGEPQTIQFQAQEAFNEAGFNVQVRLGERDRVGGKALVHEYLRWQPRPSLKEIIGSYDKTLADRIFRLHGQEKLNEYMTTFTAEKPETNLPKLQIFEENQLLIDAITNCQYDQTDKEDVAEFSGDDPYDMIRMLLSSVEYYVSNSGLDRVFINQVEDARKRLEATNDQTEFYRTMERLEAKNKAPFSVRRRRLRR